MEEEKLNNLIYLLRIHHIDSEPLENLIKGYKELQVENLELLEKIEMKKILIMRKDHTTKEIFGELYIKKDDLEKDYIPKSKIREKIEELEDLNSKFSQRVIKSKELYLTELVQNILQELLQEGDDK